MMKKEQAINFEYPQTTVSTLSEEQQINVLLAEANKVGKIWDVINVAKAISDKTKCTDLSAFQWAFSLYVLPNVKS